MQITITFDEGNSKQFTVIQDKKNYRRKRILELVAKIGLLPYGLISVVKKLKNLAFWKFLPSYFVLISWC